MRAQGARSASDKGPEHLLPVNTPGVAQSCLSLSHLLCVAQIVLLLDVEFLPPEELSRIFSDRQEYQSTLVFLYNNGVIVLPAFETLQGGTAGQTLALKLAKGE